MFCQLHVLTHSLQLWVMVLHQREEHLNFGDRVPGNLLIYDATLRIYELKFIKLYSKIHT